MTHPDQPIHFRLAIDAPGASERARLHALQAAESVLASAGATLPACYAVLAGDAGHSAAVRDALARAGMAASGTLARLGQPVADAPCLVLLAHAPATVASGQPLPPAKE